MAAALGGHPGAVTLLIVRGIRIVDPTNLCLFTKQSYHTVLQDYL